MSFGFRPAIVGFFLFLAGCQSSALPAIPLPSPAVWTTPLPTASQEFFQSLVTSTPTIGPTATPRTYKVVAGDSLGVIAARSNTTVDALIKANPGVKPELLRIGQVLVLPAAATSIPVSMPTPVGLETGPVRCATQADGALWCLGLVTNALPEPVGNVAARILLYGDAKQPPLMEQTTDLPLQRIAAGETLPVSVFFFGKGIRSGPARMQIVSAVSSSADQEIPIDMRAKDSISIEGGREVTVSFRLGAASKQAAHRIDAVLTLLDAEGLPVGMRILRQTGEWQPGQEGSIVLRAYSLTGSAEDYRLSMEARE
jgi:LysM repeat protein